MPVVVHLLTARCDEDGISKTLASEFPMRDAFAGRSFWTRRVSPLGRDIIRTTGRNPTKSPPFVIADLPNARNDGIAEFARPTKRVGDTVASDAIKGPRMFDRAFDRPKFSLLLFAATLVVLASGSPSATAEEETPAAGTASGPHPQASRAGIDPVTGAFTAPEPVAQPSVPRAARAARSKRSALEGGGVEFDVSNLQPTYFRATANEKGESEAGCTSNHDSDENSVEEQR